MQHIRFGLSIDGGAGASFRSEVGHVTLGPMGLLNVLENHLGLMRTAVPQSERVVQMRQCLRAAMTTPRFYSRSFEADELGTAATLLEWRDLWFEHGWTGRLPAGVTGRMADMDVVEALASRAVAPGLGQRLAGVADALRVRRPQIERIELLDPLSDFASAWRRVLAQLPIQEFIAHHQAGQPGTMLRDLQDAVSGARGGERPPRVPWRDDGTVRIVRGETALAAAQWLAAQARPQTWSHVVVATTGGSLLDAALAAADRPRLGLGGKSVLRPAMQLLPLAMQLLWAPLDFRALLQFLTHPLHPIHPMARRRIAERLADAPGIGGKGWQELLDQIAADLGDDGVRVMADVAFWIEHPRFVAAEKAPLSAVLERAERLADFFRNRLQDSDEARRAAWQSGHAQTTALTLALQTLMAHGETRIGAEMLDTLVAQASGRGSGNPLLDAQAWALPSVADPAAVVEAFDEVSWWQMAAVAVPPPYAWSAQEIESLRRAGVALPDPAARLQRQSRGALRPLLLARERLTLVLPPPGQEVHPVWSLIYGLVDAIRIAPIVAALGISNGLVCEKPGKPDSALGGQPMPAWMAWNWRLADACLDGLELAPGPLPCLDSARPDGSPRARWALISGLTLCFPPSSPHAGAAPPATGARVRSPL